MQKQNPIEVYPVVHVMDVRQAREQSTLALELGADGIYLISHGSMDADRLTEVFNRVSDDHEGAFIGINYLDLESGVTAYEYLDKAQKLGKINRLPNAIWADNIEGFRGHDVNELLLRRGANPDLQNVNFLGGIAFKYTGEYTDNPTEAASDTKARGRYVDVITTSGPGTGKAPPVNKIAAMKAVAGDKPIAVASGIDVTNIEDYRGIVDKILVASSVETKPYSGEFDPKKLADLIAVAHNKQLITT